MRLQNNNVPLKFGLLHNWPTIRLIYVKSFNTFDSDGELFATNIICKTSFCDKGSKKCEPNRIVCTEEGICTNFPNIFALNTLKSNGYTLSKEKKHTQAWFDGTML